MIIYPKDMTNKQLSDYLNYIRINFSELNKSEKECLLEASKRLLYLDAVTGRIQEMIKQLERS